MTIRWITPLLGTAAAAAVRDLPDIQVIDVRDLVDKAGNRVEPIREKILKGVAFLSAGKKTVVCCDYGISRSNAVAAGILASLQKITLDSAIRQVQSATGETEIKLDTLSAVRRALENPAHQLPQAAQRSVLITGATGFLGGIVRTHLVGEFEVITPSKEELDLERGGTLLDLLASEQNVGCIVHLANPRVFTSNVALGKTLTMLRNVLDVCATREISLIYPSGWEIYAGYSGSIRADESVPAFPKGPYGETKYLAEIMIERSIREANLRCALLRSSPVYGSGGEKPKFIYNFIEKAKRNEAIITHRYRNGDPALDLMHVHDLASAIFSALKRRFNGTLNLGTGTATPTNEVAALLVRMLGSSSRITHTEIDADVACIAMDWRKANKELDWRPEIALERGLERLLSESG